MSAETTLAEHEASEIARANESGRTPVVFIHGLWLLPSSWDRWAAHFEQDDFVALTPGWPDDPMTVEEANAHPEVLAGKSVGDVAAHYESIITQLNHTPVIIGHSFGGLIAQILAGRGLAAATVAVDPAPFRGVLPLPISALRSARPAVGNPLNRHKAIPLTYEQFRYAFANAVDEEEAKSLYAEFAVPAPAEPLFQAVASNINPWTEVKVDTESPNRGPLLITSGEKDHTVPWALCDAAYKLQVRNEAITEIVKLPGRGHALVIDHGWQEVAETARAFARRFV
jgi:non-heme chloroperoxidase